MLYRYPGELIESDDEYNGGDVEDNKSLRKDSDFSDSETEKTESWMKGSNNSHDLSFDSSKLIDGYKDFA